MKRFPALGASLALLLAAGCGEQTVAPRFTTLHVDTLLVCGTARYSVRYDFTNVSSTPNRFHMTNLATFPTTSSAFMHVCNRP